MFDLCIVQFLVGHYFKSIVDLRGVMAIGELLPLGNFCPIHFVLYISIDYGSKNKKFIKTKILMNIIFYSSTSLLEGFQIHSCFKYGIGHAIW